MQNLLTLTCLVTALIFVVASFFTLSAIRHAPEGHETEEGFQFGSEPDATVLSRPARAASPQAGWMSGPQHVAESVLVA